MAWRDPGNQVCRELQFGLAGSSEKVTKWSSFAKTLTNAKAGPPEVLWRPG